MEVIAEIPHISGDIDFIVKFESLKAAREAHIKLITKHGIAAPLKGDTIKIAPLAYELIKEK